MGQMSERDKQHYITRLLIEMPKHVGKSNKIGMGELYRAVFEKDFEHRINDTRRLRMLITDLRRQGMPICSTVSGEGAGYYIAAVGSEMNEYLQRLHARALKILAMEARMRKITLPELLGQMRIDIQAGGGHA